MLAGVCGCGAAVFAAAFPHVGIGLLGVSLAFGLTVLTMAYAIGHISGCHLNPAVTLGLVTGGRFPVKELLPYVLSQVIGGALGAAILYAIASGKADFSLAGGFAFERLRCALSPGSYSMMSALVAETFLTFMFLVIIWARHGRAPSGVCTDCDWPGPDADSPSSASRLPTCR